MEHYSVMLHESIEALNINPEGIYVDCTLGRAGHSKEICKRLTSGRLIAFDKDVEAIAKSKLVLEEYKDKVTIIHSDFKNIKNNLEAIGVNKIDGFLMDLGVSSPQFDDEARGFSYRFNSRLDMRMDQTQELDAYKVVNEYEFKDLVYILSCYGEEKFAKQIARAIERARELKPIETTFDLVDVIKSALPAKVLSKKGHPAKQTFQAIRIEVNQELTALKKGLEDALDMLNSDGVGAVITFHSLEDRIVKQTFNSLCKVEVVDKRIPLRASELPKADYILVNKKPLLASQNELEENNRSHSAKLRVIKRI